MKRKKLLEFAAYLERSRGRFDISDAMHCISMQACRFNGDVKGGVIEAEHADRPRLCSASYDLVRIFNMPKAQASNIRRLAHTGKVHWGKFAEHSRF